MGRIKTTPIKTLGEELLEKYNDKFTKDFEKNKKVIETIKKIKSKRIKNIVAGYITKKKRDAIRAEAEET